MLHHVELYVSDLEESRNFWRWFLGKLGYAPYQNWEQGFSYQYDNTYIVFVQAAVKYLDVPYHRSRVGLNHLAFHAQSKQQVDEMTAEIKQRGISVDRIKVELVAPQTE